MVFYISGKKIVTPSPSFEDSIENIYYITLEMKYKYWINCLLYELKEIREN